MARHGMAWHGMAGDPFYTMAMELVLKTYDGLIIATVQKVLLVWKMATQPLPPSLLFLYPALLPLSFPLPPPLSQAFAPWLAAAQHSGGLFVDYSVMNLAYPAPDNCHSMHQSLVVFQVRHARGPLRSR